MKGTNYGCSFVAKLSWRKYICFYWKKLFTEKNINENVKNIYLISEICFYTENVCAKIKYKSFLNIYSFCKKNYFDHKKYIC